MQTQSKLDSLYASYLEAKKHFDIVREGIASGFNTFKANAKAKLGWLWDLTLAPARFVWWLVCVPFRLVSWIISTTIGLTCFGLALVFMGILAFVTGQWWYFPLVFFLGTIWWLNNWYARASNPARLEAKRKARVFGALMGLLIIAVALTIGTSGCALACIIPLAVLGLLWWIPRMLRNLQPMKGGESRIHESH